MEIIFSLFALCTLGITILLLAWIATTGIWPYQDDQYLANFTIDGYRGVFVSGTFWDNYGSFRDAKQGLWGFNIAVMFPPPPFKSGIYFPKGVIPLHYRVEHVFDNEKVPLIINLTIFISLAPCLSDFIETFNLIREGVIDYTKPSTITYYHHEDTATREPHRIEYPRKEACLIQYLLDKTTPQVAEAVRRVISQKSFDEVVEGIPSIEEEIKYALAAPESVFAKAGLLKRSTSRSYLVISGPSVMPHGGIDVVLSEPVPENPEYLKSMSAPKIGINEGQQRGNRIKEAAERSGTSAEMMVIHEILSAQGTELKMFSAGDNLIEMAKNIVHGRGNNLPPHSN